MCSTGHEVSLQEGLKLTPHQMYEAVKKYETYVAHNKRLKGKSASPHANHQRAAPQTSGYKPRFHKTTTFVASVEETTDSTPTESGPSLPGEEDRHEVEPNQEDDEGLFIPSFLEEALGGDGNLQINMAHTMQAQKKQERRCFICQSPDHLMRDHYQGKNGKGPLQLKGPPNTNWLARWPNSLCPVKQCPREPLQSEKCSLPKS